MTNALDAGIDVSNWVRDGFVLKRDAFDRRVDIDVLETAITRLYLFQASRIADYCDTAMNLAQQLAHSEISNTHALCQILDMMEEFDKDALYQVQRFLPQHPEVHRLYDQNLLDYAAALLEVDPNFLLVCSFRAQRRSVFSISGIRRRIIIRNGNVFLICGCRFSPIGPQTTVPCR